MARFALAGCLVSSLALLSGCPSSADQAAPTANKSDEGKPADAPAEGDKVAAAGEDKAAADGDHDGCIYAEGEKTNKDDMECPHEMPAGGEAAEPQGPATGEGHFGNPFTLAANTAKPLGEVIAAAGDGPVMITGEVEAVCQKKGCWMVVKDGDKSARVLMKDHGFAVPMDCRGKSVTIEGELTTRTFSEKQVKHLAKDGGQDPAKVSGERTEHVLTAAGVEIAANS